MAKLALAVITRDTKEDAVLLDRLLNNVSPYVKGIFITTDTKTGEAKKIADKYGAVMSEFKWIKDFSAARNFNFAQVPEEYDYIMWSDIDDVWRGLEDLDIGDKDSYAFWYLYAFDEDKQPVVAHKKTMIVRNDGTFEWSGKIHEDLISNRDASVMFVEKIERMHLTNEVRIEEAKERNLEIAERSFKEDNDPRNFFNYGNALLGAGRYEEAKKVLNDFIEVSGSNDEKYLSRQNIANVNFHLGLREEAIEQLYICAGLEPKWPDAFLQLGQFFFDIGDLENSEKYLYHGLLMKPQYRSMIVFNPRDYDYNPMKLLAKVYYRKGRPDLALVALEGCLKINPDNKQMESTYKLMKEENDKLIEITNLIKELESIKEKDLLKTRIEALPLEIRKHPGISMMWNTHFFKAESSGKDISYYCGYTEHVWDPLLFKTKGFGGSEEAVVHLTKRWAREGYNVTVYANVGHETIVEDGVTWKPFWEFNSRDKVDLLVLWRVPKLCDYELNASKIFIDLHDVIQAGEFTKNRLEKIDKVFVKTKFHKSLFPKIPECKFEVVPNGLDIDAFAGEITKDPMMMLNTSSPDRSMEAIIKIYEKVKVRVPEAKMYWAYGWDIYDLAHEGDKKMITWKENLVRDINRVGIIPLGKVPQKDIISWYKKASVFLYPSEFAEIDCISVKKAQLAGGNVISTDFGALNESVQKGVKLHSNKNKDNWSLPYQISFAVEDPILIDEFVEQTVAALKEPKVNKEAIEFAKTYDWDIISSKWLEAFK